MICPCTIVATETEPDDESVQGTISLFGNHRISVGRGGDEYHILLHQGLRPARSSSPTQERFLRGNNILAI